MFVFEVKDVPPNTCPALGGTLAIPQSAARGGCVLRGLGGAAPALLEGLPVERKCHSDL